MMCVFCHRYDIRKWTNLHVKSQIYFDVTCTSFRHPMFGWTVRICRNASISVSHLSKIYLIWKRHEELLTSFGGGQSSHLEKSI